MTDVPTRAATPPQLTVAEAAAVLDVSPRTLRYYEELGLLCPARSRGRHRLFRPEDLETVERIKRMQAMGFSLAMIAKVLRYRAYRDDHGRRRLALEDLRTLVEESRRDRERIHDRIVELREELTQATRMAEQLDHDCDLLERSLREREAS